MNLIDKILFEAADTGHLLDRLYDRFNKDGVIIGYEIEGSVGQYKKVGTYRIPSEFKQMLEKNLNVVRDFNFPRNKSYGVKLCELNIVTSLIGFFPGTDEADKRRRHYLIIDPVSESNGNIVYAIVRNNAINTVYWGKNYIQQDAAKLRVDAVVKIDTILKQKVH